MYGRLHGETEVAQDLLELLLFAVATVDGVGVGFDDLALFADVSPQCGVIEVATIGLTHGVVEVLDIGEHCDFFHRLSSRLNQAPGPKSRPVCQPEGLFRE